MSIAAPADLEAIRRAAAEFARARISPSLQAREQSKDFDRELWKECAGFGIQGLPLPALYGGTGATLREVMATMDGLGLGSEDNGLLFALNAQLWSVEMPILRFGTEAQRARWLPGLCRGDLIGAHGMTEPESGSDAFSLATRATPQAEGYVLSGHKTFITNAPFCDLALVFATLDPADGMAGITAFVVERGTPGFESGRIEEKMGLHTAPLGDLSLEGCWIPAENRLGRAGQGASIFNSSMEWERAAILSTCTGAMERELARAIDYAHQRRQFGQEIGRFPAVANRIAEMQVRLEASRGLLERVAKVKDEGGSAVLKAAVAKLYVSEAWVQSSLDAQAIYGAYGYTVSNGIERQVRDSLASRIYSGTSDIQRQLIARLAGL